MSTLAVSPTTVTISLYFREGSSDKVYHAQIAPDGNDLYSVNFQYGRRGSTLQAGTKTTAPVALVQAQKIFDKLVAEKGPKGTPMGRVESRTRVEIWRIAASSTLRNCSTSSTNPPCSIPSPSGLADAGEDGRCSPDRRASWR
jgi:hypothetical protein